MGGTRIVVQCHFSVSLLDEVSVWRSRRDDEAIQLIVEEEQRRDPRDEPTRDRVGVTLDE